MRSPPRKQWPPSLRALCRSHRGMYPKLEMMRYLAPYVIIWLVESWNTPDGKSLIREINAMEAYEFLDLVENGKSALSHSIKPAPSAKSATPVKPTKARRSPTSGKARKPAGKGKR